MRIVFERYIKSHEETANGFEFLNSSNNYNVSIWFDINKSGNVFNLKSKKYYAQIDSFCNSALSAFLKRTKWKPLYKINPKSKTCMDTEAIMSFEIKMGKINSLRIRELKTDIDSYACSN